MRKGDETANIVRFGVFELDRRARELRKQGRRVHLQEKPFELLVVLLEHPGEIVGRDELRSRLWPEDTFVVFDDNLNTAVRKVRDALGDVPRGSVFVETIPRRGYRFVAPVQRVGAPGAVERSVEDVPPHVAPYGNGIPRKVAAMGVLLMAAVAAMLVAARDSRPRSPTRMLQTNVLTTAPGTEYLPTWAPDGARLAFAADSRGDFDIWVRQVSSDAAIVVSGDFHGQDLNPAWSPDGEWIAFASEREGGGIYVVPAMGGPPRRIASTPFTASRDLLGSVPTVAWSPDGLRVAFAYGIEDQATVSIVQVHAGTIRRVELPSSIRPFSIVQPAWSPDGRHLAFVALSGSLRTVSQIWISRDDGTDLKALTDGKYQDLQPVWTAQDDIFFLSNRSGAADIYVVDVNPDEQRIGEPQALTVGVGIDSFAVSKDKRRVAYSKAVERSNIWMLMLDGEISWRAAGPLTADNQTVEFVELSADGEWLVFDSSRAGNSDIWRVRVDGSSLQQITNGPEDEWHPTLSPDGQLVAFHALKAGNREIFSMPVTGGARVQLTDHPAKDWLPRRSPDENWIAFVSDRAGNQDIFLVRDTGGAVRQLTDDPANDHNPLWSGDGRSVLFASNRTGGNELFTVSRDGGVATRITRAGWEDLVPLVLSKDRQVVYAWGRSREGTVALHEIALADGSAEVLLPAGFASHQVGVSAATDGRRLFFPVWERSADLWLGELTTERR